MQFGAIFLDWFQVDGCRRPFFAYAVAARGQTNVAMQLEWKSMLMLALTAAVLGYSF